MSAPFSINGFAPAPGDIIFLPTAESPWRVAMLVLYDEENAFWELRKVEHDVLRALSPRAYAIGIERANGMGPGFSLRAAG